MCVNPSRGGGGIAFAHMRKTVVSSSVQFRRQFAEDGRGPGVRFRRLLLLQCEGDDAEAIEDVVRRSHFGEHCVARGDSRERLARTIQFFVDVVFDCPHELSGRVGCGCDAFCRVQSHKIGAVRSLAVDTGKQRPHVAEYDHAVLPWEPVSNFKKHVPHFRTPDVWIRHCHITPDTKFHTGGTARGFAEAYALATSDAVVAPDPDPLGTFDPPERAWEGGGA